MANPNELLYAAIRLVNSGNSSMFPAVRELSEPELMNEIEENFEDAEIQSEILDKLYTRLEDELHTLDNPEDFWELAQHILNEEIENEIAISAEEDSADIEVEPERYIDSKEDSSDIEVEPKTYKDSEAELAPEVEDNETQSHAEVEKQSDIEQPTYTKDYTGKFKRKCTFWSVIIIILMVITVNFRERIILFVNENYTRSQGTVETEKSVSTTKDDEKTESEKLVDVTIQDLSDERDALYDALNEYRNENGLPAIEINYSYEEAATKFNSEVLPEINENDNSWIDKANSTYESIAREYGYSEEGWQYHPYLGSVSGDDVAKDIINYNEDLAANAPYAINLKNCEEIGISVGVNDGRIMAYAIIYK